MQNIEQIEAFVLLSLALDFMFLLLVVIVLL